MDRVRKEVWRKRQAFRFRHLLRFERLFSRVWRRFPVGSYMLRMHFDAVERPHYAYGLYSACLQARALEIPRISVYEFGVAGGNGLVALDKASARIGGALGVDVDIVGFDLGSGLPEFVDYRDFPYWFLPGSYRQDEQAIRERLPNARLVLGDVKDTVPQFLEDFDLGPIGFCVFDLDSYTGTLSALGLLRGDAATRLPRVLCYFDDLYNISDLVMSCQRVGPLAAIAEFNAAGRSLSVEPIHLLGSTRVVQAEWNEAMYACHDFDHPLYGRRVNPFTPELATQALALRK